MQELQQKLSACSSTRADSEFELAGGEGGGGRRKMMRTSGPDQASATRLVVLGFEKTLSGGVSQGSGGPYCRCVQSSRGGADRSSMRSHEEGDS
eukprot:2871977-Pyramimonas_sp.AAC.1